MTRLALAAVLLVGIAASPSGGQSSAEQIVLDVELEVVSVDLELQQITLQDPTSKTPYIGKVDKKTKMKAKKKVFRGKLKLENLSKGDLVNVKLDPVDSRLLEVQLLKRAQDS